MKVSKETMAEHREQIIASAAKRFRERGFDGISVADLMKEVGLTHGGFYGHFSSKEELTALAAGRAIDDTASRWEKWIDEAEGDPLEAFTNKYLSLFHYGHPEIGCLLAATGTELARQPDSVKKVVTESMGRFFDVIGKAVPGRTAVARKKNAISVFAALIGGMILARNISDPELREQIFQSLAASVPRSVQEPRPKKLNAVSS
jgi:TetR/AcrR family transcriptional repressor of nem operon